MDAILEIIVMHYCFSNCCMRTKSDMPATVQWYMGIVRKKLKDKEFAFNKCSYIENIINMFFI
jgi:hypothetical protein